MFPRRDPEAIIAAHKMDPARREVYVEGQSDRLFLLYIAGPNLRNDVLIQEISSVNIEGPIEGGERGRLVYFANLIDGQPVNIQIFLDADYSRSPNFIEQFPANTILTDGRDLEGYFLREDCFEKIVRLGLTSEQYTGNQLLVSILGLGRQLGLIRLHSKLGDLNLPFQRTNLERYIDFRPCRFTFNKKKYISALVHNAQISRREVDRFLVEIDALGLSEVGTRDLDLINGKDVTALFSRVLRFHRIGADSSKVILRTSFDRNYVPEYPQLSNVAEFISI